MYVLKILVLVQLEQHCTCTAGTYKNRLCLPVLVSKIKTSMPSVVVFRHIILEREHYKDVALQGCGVSFLL